MIRLYNDDCLNILKNYNGEPFDHVVVDLPYFKIVKDEFDNQWKTLSEYLDWVRMCFTYIKPHLKEQSNIIVFTTTVQGSPRLQSWEELDEHPLN